MFAVDAQETTRRHAHGETFDVHGLALTQDNAILDEPCGRLTEHDTARRCRRFHPLGHAHLFTHCGVTEVGRADFTGDHSTGIEADAQTEVDPVPATYLDSQLPNHLLDIQNRETRTKCVMLQCDWGPEESHDPVAGELVHGAAVALHHGCRLIDELGHHFAQPLGAEGCGDIHRPHHVGEQDGHLFVFGRLNTRRQRRAAHIAEPRPLTRL